MDPTSRGTLITGRMSTNDLLKGSDMDRSIVGGMDKFSMGMDTPHFAMAPQARLPLTCKTTLVQPSSPACNRGYGAITATLRW